MTEKKRFSRGGHFYSLIQNNESNGFPLISRIAGMDLLFKSNHITRCRSKFQDGKDDFQKQLIDARKVIFNKEDLANWLYKIKEEARTETDLVFIKARANYLNDDQIDFERVGYMAGFYDEAERLLKIMTALEPI